MAPLKQKSGLEEVSRFDMPKASISFDKEGRPIFGLPATPARAQLAYQFEAAKAASNQAVQDRLAHPPSGRRGAGREDIEDEWARRRLQEAEQQVQLQRLHGERAERRTLHLRTSPDNFLGAHVAGAGGASGARSVGLHRVQSIRTYTQPGLPASQQVHVDNCCYPLGDDEEEDLRATELAEQARSQMEQMAAARELGRDYCRMYPHGVPRQVLAQARSKGGEAALLADLPPLGAYSVSLHLQ